MSDPLKPEIWALVFHHLRQQLPARHASPKPARKAIRQSDLASVLRVSKVIPRTTLHVIALTARTWHALAAPILYNTVVVDDFGLLLYGLKTGGISGVENKVALLGRIRQLFIEYQYKEYNPQITYRDIFKYQVWDCLSDGPGETVRRADWQGVRETMEICDAWLMLLDKGGKYKAVFTRLRTLATGGIFGQEEELWRRIGTRFDERSQTILNAQRGMLNFTVSTPSLRHYCQAGSVGPLCLGVTYIGDTEQNKPTIASHNTYEDPTLLPISIGVQSRFYIHSTPGEQGTRDWARRNLEDACRTRGNIATDEAFARSVPDWGIVGGLYYPPPEMPAHLRRGEDKEGKREQWRGAAVDFQKELGSDIGRRSRALPSYVKAKDDWKVAPIYDAPMCSGCQWQYDESTAPPTGLSLSNALAGMNHFAL